MIALVAGLFALPAAAADRVPAAAHVTVLRGGDGVASASGTVETVAFAGSGAATVTVLRGEALVAPPKGAVSAAPVRDLDRVAFAVDGAESRHGADPGMWRPALDGPEGPMQVSAAAAFDVGGGDRFDLGENRALGRAYLARLYGRYGNWPDAVAAYNWGPGNLDAWIAGGRLSSGLPPAVEGYRDRVLRGLGPLKSPPAGQAR